MSSPGTLPKIRIANRGELAIRIARAAAERGLRAVAVAPMMSVSWPTGVFGGMGLEGAVKLAYAKELAAETDPEAREALYQRHLAELHQLGKALTVAEYFGIDDVIDPAGTRRWLVRGLRSSPPAPPRTGKRRPHIDPR